MAVRPPTFRPKGARSRREAVAEYDARRGSARERGYSRRWDKASATYRRQHPLCIGCEAVGRVVAATITDHIEPHRGDQKKFWDKDNWQPACDWHHSVVKQRLEALFDKGLACVDDLRLDSEIARKIGLQCG